MQVTRAMVRPWLISVLVLSTVLTACTADDPAPQPAPAAPVQDEPATSAVGASVAVVLPSDLELDASVQAGLEREVARLDGWADDGIREVRAVVADGPEFVGDLAELLAERGTDLVCVLGPDGPGVVEPLAARYGDVRFCSIRVASLAPAAEGSDEDGGDDAATRTRVRVGELGHAVGVAAAELAGEGAVALVLGGDELPTARFRAGLLAALGGTEVIEPSADDEASGLERRVRQAVDDGADVIVVDGGPGAVEAIEAIDASVTVLGPTAVVEEVDAPGTGAGIGMSWRVRWDLVLRGPVLELLGEEPRSGALGFADEAFVLEFGPAADDEVTAAVTAAVEELARGDRAALRAAPGEGTAPSDGGSGAEDGDGAGGGGSADEGEDG